MSYRSDKVKAWRRRTKERIIMTMGGRCVCCDYNKCQGSLALHHLNPNEKDFTLGSIRANPKSWEKIIIELRKCVLVCHNCHCEIHEGIRKVPKEYAKFNEKFVNYKELERKERLKDPLRYHTCPKCQKQTPNYKKHCSRKCSAAAALSFNWGKYDLEKMYKEMPILQMAKIIGCSDVAVHKRLKRMGLK